MHLSARDWPRDSEGVRSAFHVGRLNLVLLGNAAEATMSTTIKPDHGAEVSRVKLAFGVFAVIGGGLVIVEHRAHVLPFLPWLLLAACPLIHRFIQGGHGHHHRHDGGIRPDAARDQPVQVDTEMGTEKGNIANTVETRHERYRVHLRSRVVGGHQLAGLSLSRLALRGRSRSARSRLE